MEKVLSNHNTHSTRGKILLLTQWFEPEPCFKGLAFAKKLADIGFDVEVLTGFPNYPDGKIYPGYKIRWRQKENIQGIKVTRVALFPSHDRSALKRIINYATFAFSAAFYGSFIARKVDLIYAYHPPLTVGFAACTIKFFTSAKVVYDIQDMWPDTLRSTGMLNNGYLIKLVYWACQKIYKWVDHIVVLSPGFKRLLVKRDVKEEKIDVIYNWCNESPNKITPQKTVLPENLNDRFVLLFAGNLGKAQSLESVIEAATMLEKSNSKVAFVFLGTGVEIHNLKEIVDSKRLSNVFFIPKVSMNKVDQYLYEASALLVHLVNDPLFEITIPSKTQAYMKAGKPILMAVKGDAASLVNEAGCGVCIEPNNPKALYNALLDIEAMATDMLNEIGDNGKKYYNTCLAMDVGVSNFVKVFEKVLRL